MMMIMKMVMVMMVDVTFFRHGHHPGASSCYQTKPLLQLPIHGVCI